MERREKNIEEDCKLRLTSFCVKPPRFEHACWCPAASHGETFVDQQNGYDSRYTFSAKEKDDETQYSYFGARYYDSDLSVWLSVDPMAHKYPSMSSYMYCAGNPVMLVDPNGMEIDFDGTFGEKVKMKIATIALRIQSKTFRQLYRDLKYSDNTTTVKLGDEWGRETEEWNFEKGSNTTITMNLKGLPEGTEEGTTIAAAIGHEFGHAWLSDRGLGEPVTPQYAVSPFDAKFSSADMVDNINTRNYEYTKFQETEACHIENMIRSEIGSPLRKTYNSIESYSKDFLGNTHVSRDILNVIKPSYNYSRKNNNIDNYYGVLPKRRKK